MNSLTLLYRHSVLVLAVAPLVVGVGCRTSATADAERWKFADLFDLDKGMPWQREREPKIHTPVRMADSWTEAVRHKPGEKSQRGFGGRVHFYGTVDDQPIAVDGQLVVYAFDETDRDPTDNRPTKRYVFPPEQLKLHRSDSEFGPSYSVWLPWDEIGGAQTEVSLVCRFEPRRGSLIVGEQNRQHLGGILVASKNQQEQSSPPAAGSDVQQAVLTGESSGKDAKTVSYDAAENAASTSLNRSQRQMTTTTISLPQSFSRK